eukprot:PITA_30850
MVLRSGAATGEDTRKVTRVDARVRKETDVEARESFTEVSTPSSKDQTEPERGPSMLTTLLETCMKLLHDNRVVKGLKELITRYTGSWEPRAVKDDKDDPKNINNPETEGSCEVHRQEIKDPDIIVLLKMKQVKIGMEEEPKYATLEDSWDNAMVENVVELLREYQDLFPTKITELKRIPSDLGMMKITLKSDAKPVKQRPYRLNQKYKAKVREELDKMLAAGIIEPVEKSDWVIPMVVQEKK